MNRKPEIKVLGVYRLDVTPALLEAQFNELYGYDMTEQERRRVRTQCRNQLESVVLVETLIKKPDVNFSIADFTQKQPGLPRDSWQGAYLTHFLDFEGNVVLPCEDYGLPKVDCYRCAFFLHFFREGSPLLTSYGERFCPPVSTMSDRLQRLVPFMPVD